MEQEEQKKGQPKSDIEWYLEQANDPEYKHYLEILMRMCRLYRVRKMTQETTDLLEKMACAIRDCESEAKEKGLELNPLSAAELEAAYPLNAGIIDAGILGAAKSKQDQEETSSQLGLASALGRTKGCSLRIRAKRLWGELRYAWQRAWKGYDDTDVCDLGLNLVLRMPILLREFKKHNDTLFRDPMTKREYTEEETDRIIDRMIFCFENCDEEEVYQRLYGVSSWEDEYKAERDQTVLRELKACRTEAFRLLSKWCFSLWC